MSQGQQILGPGGDCHSIYGGTGGAGLNTQTVLALGLPGTQRCRMRLIPGTS